MKYNLNNYDFKELATWMDGGSITLYFINKNNEELSIHIQQHIIHEYYQEISNIPGRIYLNDSIINKRSSTEKLILQFLKENILNKLDGLERKILIEKIQWITSNEYEIFSPIKLELSASRKKQMIKEMNAVIVNNLFEFWKHIGTLTNRLSANKNYYSVSMTTSDWPNRVFDVTNNDDAVLQEIKELSQEGKLPEILSVMNHTDSLNNSDFELAFQQKNMAIDLHKFSESTITNSNIKAVKSEKEATLFAKVATEAFGYLVDEKVVFEIVRNSSQTQLFTYQENGEVLGCGIVFFDTEHYAGLHMIGTIPKGRGKGIGKSMTKHLLQIAKNNTATHCVLHASKMGESIYKKLGFETYGELKNYRILKRK